LQVAPAILSPGGPNRLLRISYNSASISSDSASASAALFIRITGLVMKHRWFLLDLFVFQQLFLKAFNEIRDLCTSIAEPVNHDTLFVLRLPDPLRKALRRRKNTEYGSPTLDT
jgi:hypothetical protein